MEKKKLILLVALLSGCAKQNSYACSRVNAEAEIYLNIEALGDRIVSVEMTERYGLPHDLLPDEERSGRLSAQLDEGCFFHGNDLYCRNVFMPEEDYSLTKTMEDLKRKRFNCE